MNIELGSAYSIIWLDAHICKPGQCGQIKLDFTMKLLETAAVPPAPLDPKIDGLILQIREHGTPVIFVSTEDEALEQIRKSLLFRKVIFITSATFGRIIIPQILDEKLKIYAYYIFCGDISAHADWGFECLKKGLKMEMFDFETILLIRLARDMSRELIDEGTKLLNLGHCESALKYFQYARSIAEKGVVLDTPTDPNDTHRPSADHRRILDGEKGLITQAQNLCKKKTSC